MAKAIWVILMPLAKEKIMELSEFNFRKVMAAKASLEAGALPTRAEGYEFEVFGTNLILVCDSSMENFVQIVEVLDLNKREKP